MKVLMKVDEGFAVDTFRAYLDFAKAFECAS